MTEHAQEQWLFDDERLSTAVLSDACDEVGLRDQVLQERLAPLAPGTRICGRARTVQFVPSTLVDEADPYGDAIHFISSLKPGEVVVIATGDSNVSGFWGELFSAAAMGAGAVGIITDGNIRDTDKVIELGFGAFSRSRRPIDFRNRMRISEVDTEVHLAGTRVRPGDVVMGDDDGVVVVPAESQEQVAALSMSRVSKESNVLQELLAGEPMREVWNRYQVL